MNSRTIGSAILALLVLLLAVPVVAKELPGVRGAARGKAQPSIAGTVTSVGGTTIGLEARNGKTYQVDASNAVIIRLPHTEITVDDIKVGNAVLVHGKVSDSTIAAARIMVGVAAGDTDRPKPTMFPDGKRLLRGEVRREEGKRFGGIVGAISSPSFTLTKPGEDDDEGEEDTDDRWPLTVMTNASTTFVSMGGTTSFGALRVGSHVVVFGAYASSTRTVTAKLVEIGTSTPRMKMREMRGEDRKDMRDEIRSLVAGRLQSELGTTTPPRALVRDIVHSIWGGIARFLNNR